MDTEFRCIVTMIVFTFVMPSPREYIKGAVLLGNVKQL